MALPKQNFLVLALLCLGLNAVAQNPFARYKVEKIDARQGLTSDFIFNTYQSKEGYLWMSSYAGFIRYDGKKFETFNTKNTPLIKADNSNGLFTQSADSTMWFPTPSSGLLSFKNGIFKAYLTDQPGLTFVGRTAKGEFLLNVLTGFQNDVNNLIVFDPKTYQYKTTTRENLLKIRTTRNNQTDTSLTRWFVQKGILHYRHPSKGDLSFPVWSNPSTKKERVDMTFTNFFKDSQNRLWITTEYGLFTWNGETILPYPGMQWARIVQANPSFGHIAEDKQGGIWLSTGNGLSYLPPGEKTFVAFPPALLNIQTLHNVNIDKEDNIWLATDRGLFKITHTNLVNYAAAEGIENNRVSAVSQTGPDQFLVVGSNSKIYQLSKGMVKPWPLRQKDLLDQSRNILYSFSEPNGTSWICSDANIFKLNDREEKRIPVDGQVRYAARGRDGRLYFAVSFKGIGFVNDKQVFEYLSFPGVDFSSTYISTFFQHKDGTWVIGTYRTGILFIYPNGKTENLELFDDTKGIQAFDFYPENDSTIWVASGKGLVRLRGKKKEYIGSSAGLEELSLFKILPDQQGNWWLPTNVGIYQVKKSSLDAYLNNPSQNKILWRLFDEGDGMYNRQCVGARHSMVTNDGRVLVLGIGGLIEINPQKISQNKVLPSVAIRQVWVDDKAYPMGMKQVTPPGNHRYIFDYSVLSLMAPEKNQVKFRLVGYDKDWIISKGDQRAFYTGLGPGEYRFEVMGSNNDGLWAAQPAVYEFEVAPLFYQTTWFKLLLVALVLFLLWALVRWRTQAARLANQKLETQVKERTAALQNSLDQLQAAQKQLVQSEKMASLGELTADIAHEIQNPLNFVNNFSEVSEDLVDEMNAEIETGQEQLKNGYSAEAAASFQNAVDIAKDVKMNLEKINHHGKRADGIVKGMLQHSRTGSGQKETTDLVALCDEYLRLAYHGYRAKDSSFQADFELKAADNLPLVSVVPQEMGRVILNLINNAFYAVNEKAKTKQENYAPKVVVTIDKLVNGQVGQSGLSVSGSSLPAYNVRIRVQDNGPGIPPSVQEKIFQPFFTTKPTGQGTGLGLSLSYDIVKAHGGSLVVEPLPEGGTFFQIQLPV